METNHQQPIQASTPSFFKQFINSMIFKMFTILVLVLFLLIPLNWIDDLIRERKYRENAVTEDIVAKWGNEQVVSGPIIAIPLDYRAGSTVFDKDNKPLQTFSTEREWIFLLPTQLHIDGSVQPEELKRGIYKSVVYNTTLKMKGAFDSLNMEEVDAKGGVIQWAEAKLVVGITDFKGLLSYPALSWNGVKSQMTNSDNSFNLFAENLVADLALSSAEGTKQNFDIELQLRGAKSLNFFPLANQTDIQVSGDWADPSFNGGFLPEDREVTDQGFAANWRIPNFSRKFPQQWQGSNGNRMYIYSGMNTSGDEYYDAATTVEYAASETSNKGTNIEPATDNDLVQIQFLRKVNEYQKITRVAKYGALVIFLTFAALVLTEIIKKQRIHIIQYVLIGVAVVLFYSLLLAVSEHLGFNLAYLVAAMATVLLIASFVHLLTKRLGIALGFGAILSSFYTFIYFLMQLQDHSLIVGTIGVFLILAVLMRFSARINWYSLDNTNAKNGLNSDK